MITRFYNAHGHCFTMDHVPNYIFGKWIPVSWLLSRKWLLQLIHNAPVNAKFGFWGSILKALVSVLLGFNKSAIIRYLNVVRFGYADTQAEVIEKFRAYYPANTGLALLTVDLEYAGAGRPRKRFEQQLAELAEVKRTAPYGGLLYPFLCCDPRRLDPQTPREKAVEPDFAGEKFGSALERYLSGGAYHGLKMYPATGFFPFDRRMKKAYDLALALQLPIVTHCEIGVIHLKYEPAAAETYHPFLQTQLPDQKLSVFQQFFTHPLNYECLLNRDLLRQYWGEDAPDYRALKICFAHWGGGNSWHEFLDNAWRDVGLRARDGAYPSLDLANWHVQPDEQYQNFSWFSIICDLMRKYPNVYADISFTLSDTSLLPLLKMILEADDVIRQRVLFGTDFYVVSTAISERSFGVHVRAFLGAELFEQIAVKNVEAFLARRETAATSTTPEKATGVQSVPMS